MWNAFHKDRQSPKSELLQATRGPPDASSKHFGGLRFTQEEAYNSDHENEHDHGHNLHAGNRLSLKKHGAWEAGMLIQDAMPDVDTPLREFIKSGVTPEEWNSMFGWPPQAPRRKWA